jgi:hypothetical protein
VTPQRRKQFWTIAQVLFVVLAIAFVARVAANNRNELRHVDLHLHPIWLFAAAPFTFMGGLLLPLGWRQVIAAYSATMRRLTAIRVWCLSQATRYVPTGVAALASRVVLANREGVPRGVAAVSLGLEGGLLVLWAGVMTAFLLPSSILAWWLRVLLGTGAVLSLLFLPLLLAIAGKLIPKRFEALSPAAHHPRQVYEAVILYGINVIVRTIGSIFVVSALLPVHGSDVALIGGASNAAALIGLVGFTPAGLGVREGAFAAIARHRYGLGDATAVAVALRAWEFLFELVWLSVATAITQHDARIKKGSTAPTR